MESSPSQVCPQCQKSFKRLATHKCKVQRPQAPQAPQYKQLPTIKPVFGQISIESEEIEECVFMIDEDEDEQDQEVQSVSIKCNACCQSIQDLESALVVCSCCRVKQDCTQTTQYIDINQETQPIEQELGEVYDIRVHQDRFQCVLYAPTRDNINRRVNLKNLIWFEPDGSQKIISTEQYQASADHVHHVVNPSKYTFYPSQLSLFKDLTREQAEKYYVHNPRMQSKKPFQYKLLTELYCQNKVKFIQTESVKVYYDIETFNSKDFKQVPFPDQKDSQIGVIQVLIEKPGQQPQIYIITHKFYQFDNQALLKEYQGFELIFNVFQRERDIVNRFWEILIGLKCFAYIIGFNSSHAFSNDQPDQYTIYGYDLNWLVSRSSYKLSAFNHQIKINGESRKSLSTQIKQLPNLLFLDYQQLYLRVSLQEERNKLASFSLKDILKTLNLGDLVVKIEEDYENLQKLLSNQQDPLKEREDLTNIIKYAINDVLCLYRAEQIKKYAEQIISTSVEYFQYGILDVYAFTSAQTNLPQLQRLDMQAGRAPRYQTLKQDQTQSFSGAYTMNMPQYVNKTTPYLLQLDFSSLYPSCIIHANISPDVYHGLCQLIDGQYVDINGEILDTNNYNMIELSDDQAFNGADNRTFAAYLRSKEGSLKTLCSRLITQRALYKANNNKQLEMLVKCQNNSVFGSTGSTQNPYYKYEVAASITAYSRYSLQSLSWAIHQRYGYIDSSSFDQNNQRMIKIDGIWTRNYALGENSRITSADTDAVNYIIPRHLIDEGIRNVDKSQEIYEREVNEINKIIRSYSFYPNCTRLSVCAGEWVISSFISSAKKSYGMFYIPESVFKQEWATITKNLEDNNADIVQLFKDKKLAIKVKGISWSSYDQAFRDKINDLFKKILMDKECQRSEIVKKHVKDFQDDLSIEFNEALDQFKITQDHSLLVNYCLRVKTSGKSLLIQHLNKTYKLSGNFSYILPIQKQYPGQGLSECYMPLTELSKHNIHKIDQTRVFQKINSDIQKFFESEQDKNKDTKKSKMQINIQDLVPQIDAQTLLIRFESAQNKQAKYELINVNHLQKFILNNDYKYTFHEIIHSQITKLFFDIDAKTNDVDLNLFRSCVHQEISNLGLAQPTNMYICERLDRGTGANTKISYHITFNIAYPIDISKMIAESMIAQFPQIDLQVYKQYKTLRCPLSCKRSNTRNPDLQSLLTPRDCSFKDCLITYIEDIQVVQNPICFSNTPSINMIGVNSIQYMGQEHFNQSLKDVMQTLEFIEKRSDQSQIFKVRQGHQCVGCLKFHTGKHESLRLLMTRNVTHIKIQCFRPRLDSSPSIATYEINQEIIQQERVNQLVLNTNAQFNYQLINPNQDQKYVQFESNSRLSFILSNMGSGKTEGIIKALKQSQQNNETQLMLSVRNTLSTSWIARYQNSGVNMQDYRAKQGQLSLEDSQCLVLQVDSLARLHQTPDLLILDEIQSILTQLSNKHMLDQVKILNGFIGLIKMSKRIICLDANLQVQTINLIKYLANSEDSQITYNKFKSYSDYRVNISRFRGHNLDHLLKEFEQSVIVDKQNVIGHITSYTTCQKIQSHLQSINSDIKVLILHGQNLQVEQNGQYHQTLKQDVLQNLDQLSQYQVFLYTSTLTCGVDIQQAHFHKSINVFARNTSQIDSFVQGIMRCRHLINKQISIYTETKPSDYQNITPKIITDNILQGYSKHSVQNQNVLNELFNLQIFISCNQKILKHQPEEYLVASLNQMGMQIIQNADVQQSRQIMQTIKVQTNHISYDLIQRTPQITLQACEYQQIEGSNKEKLKETYIASHEISHEFIQNAPIITYLCTKHNEALKQMSAFETPQILQQALNNLLIEEQKKTPEEVKKDLLEYERHQKSKQYRCFGKEIYKLTLNELDHNIRQALIQQRSQFHSDTHSRSNNITDIDLHQNSTNIRQCLIKFKEIQETKHIGSKELNHIYKILTPLGLTHTQTITRTRQSGKQVYNHQIQIKQFFSNEIILELND